MKKLITLSIVVSGVALISLFQNCSKVSVQEIGKVSGGSVTPQGGDVVTPPGPTPDPIKVTDELKESCALAQEQNRTTHKLSTITFGDSEADACKWGENGNLAIKNGYVQARNEQFSSISLPAGATVCNIKMENVDNPSFEYDDNIIMTINNYIIASTTNFTRHFSTNEGFYIYDWSKLVTKPAQNTEADTTVAKQYCAGSMADGSECKFPLTQEQGAIVLNFDSSVIQSILALTDPSKVNLGVITTGDNDDKGSNSDTGDCRHVPVQFNVDVEYF